MNLVISRVFCQGIAARYAALRQILLNYPITFISRILSVSTSGFYACQDRLVSKWAREETRLEIEIRTAYNQARQTSGAERLQQNLMEHGIQVDI